MRLACLLTVCVAISGCKTLQPVDVRAAWSELDVGQRIYVRTHRGGSSELTITELTASMLTGIPGSAPQGLRAGRGPRSKAAPTGRAAAPPEQGNSITLARDSIAELRVLRVSPAKTGNAVGFGMGAASVLERIPPHP